MPAVSRAVNILTRTIQARQTVTFTSPPPFPPFRQPDDIDDDDNPFRVDPDDLRDDDKLSAGTIAAIVISIVVFLIVITGLVVFLVYRRRKAQRNIDIAIKEESISMTPVTASGALDPPPPYDDSHLDSHHSGQERSGSRSDFSQSGEEEENDEMGSHATITDGLAPGRHVDAETPAGMNTKDDDDGHE
ncbi:uncharacterized protein B0H64DRAFT_378675 [Chaetomium fimeti]|uniref:Uncharacterized protein n=1 Tax=Chaetomium fimeti TaxID=1854472 RepID=A0AAE0H5P6_9PEZI|nr:hypothetical protein B0H64DRAFT_378675 [Chaetomium fimeti]